MATRTSSPTGTRSTSKSSGSGTRTRSTSSKATPKAAQRKPAQKRPASRGKKPVPGKNPVAVVVVALVTAIKAIWMSFARLTGGIVRSFGHHHELDPELRRDGAGLLLLACAALSASAVWFEVGGPVFHLIQITLTGIIGKVAWVAPLAFGAAALRTLRHPMPHGPTGRALVGWSAIAMGTLGVVHLANGNPHPVAGDASNLRGAGGAVGYVVSSLLLDLMRSAYLVVPTLVLLAFVGLLIVTATPLYEIPHRVQEAIDKVTGRVV
ncbi:MAG TPA: DNA translocase FtsK 4TM domain-containing protein, partial [Nocardioides sp.]|nr:DNA translocase FtsK 4TM domain-containing protein [Nocardioides sp.]